jgi:DNA-binding NtrC family response regulator
MTTIALYSDCKDRLSTIVASPDPLFRQRILQQLAARSWFAEEASGGAEALALLEGRKCRTLLLDRCLPDLDPNELIGTVRTRHPEVEILVLDSQAIKTTASDSPGLALGSSELFQLLQGSSGARIPAELPEPVLRPLAPSTVSGEDFEPLPGMTGHSLSLRRVCRLTRLVAARQTSVLLTGETGTGKELVARALHELSPRRERPFVVVNCAAIPEPLLEAELFGYNRGAFTGAFQSRLGRIQMAQGGTVLLDEVGDLPVSMQAKILRFLQEGEIQRLGSSETSRVDVRVVAATNANLLRLVKEGRFREDLYYRVSVFPIEIDPLRLRREDIAPLSAHFLDHFCQEAHVPAKTFSSQAARALEQHAWPGNVRELRQVIERAFILAEEQPEIQPEHFSLHVGGHPPETNLRTAA